MSDIMASAEASRILKLGLHLEYLRGIVSSYGGRPAGIDHFPYLRENEPAVRFAANKVAAVLRSLFAELKELKFTRTLETAEEFRPMLGEVESFLARSSDPHTIYLQDHFADSLVRIAEKVLATLREEIPSAANATES